MSEDADRLVQRLRYDFPNLPEQLLVDALVEGAREMAKCGLLQANIDLTQDVQGGVADYEFKSYLPEDYDVNCIESVEFCGRCIDAIDPKCMACPYGYQICGPSAIRLFPCPSNAPGQTLELCVSIKPNSNSCLIPDVFADQYPNILRDFARAEIISMPQQEFTDLRASLRYRDKARVEAKLEAEKLMPEGTASTQVRQAKGSRWF